MYNFLKFGKRSDWGKEHKPGTHHHHHHHQRQQPSLLYIPNTILSLCDERNDVELIANGTCAIVFKATTVAVIGTLFDQTTKEEDDSQLANTFSSIEWWHMPARLDGSAFARRFQRLESALQDVVLWQHLMHVLPLCLQAQHSSGECRGSTVHSNVCIIVSCAITVHGLSPSAY